MHWYIWWGISAIIFLVTLMDAFVISKLRYKRKRILTPNKMLILGTFLSAAVLFCPLYLEIFSDPLWWVEWGKSILLSLQHAIRLFAFEGGFLEFFETETIYNLPKSVQMLYTGTSAFFYAMAPLLTFGLLLSFFKNITAYRNYLFSFWKHTHVFSELNKKSLALAKSIDETHNMVGKAERRRYRLFRKALIVFTGVPNKDNEELQGLIEEVKEIGAILFSKDMESVKYRNTKYSVRKVSFYLISENEQEKLRHAERIMNDYDLADVELRVFSDDTRSELLLAAKDVKHMKVIGINDIQSLTYHNLDVHGMRLFQNARADKSSTEKVISAVVVGLGRYGKEIIKALSWFCQMDGYKLKINAFDIHSSAEDRFINLCPELMSEEYNRRDIPGEPRYEINIHSGIDVKSKTFFEQFSKITDTTYVFVCLGNDADNLDASVMIRSFSEKIQYSGDGHKPDIETVIYDSSISKSMGVEWSPSNAKHCHKGVTNFKNQCYNIHMIGALEDLYSVETIINSEMVRLAEDANKNYAEHAYDTELEKIVDLPEPQYSEKKLRIERQREENIRAFYKYKYNYRSSIARMIHEKKSVDLHLKSPELEHKRWNAYMRSEGYCFSGSKDESSRNDLAKLHHNLVPFENLDTKRDVPKDS
ncbi:MAG: hypothetical protein IJX19_02645 [Clostridia bacterium]|nr:hypothetical protein [Clostridia bacterium]